MQPLLFQLEIRCQVKGLNGPLAESAVSRLQTPEHVGGVDDSLAAELVVHFVGAFVLDLDVVAASDYEPDEGVQHVLGLIRHLDV